MTDSPKSPVPTVEEEATSSDSTNYANYASYAREQFPMMQSLKESEEKFIYHDRRERQILQPGESLYHLRIGTGSLEESIIDMNNNTEPLNTFLEIFNEREFQNDVTVTCYGSDHILPSSSQPPHGQPFLPGYIQNFSVVTESQDSVLCLSFMSPEGVLKGQTIVTCSHLVNMGHQMLQLPIINCDNVVGSVKVNFLQVSSFDHLLNYDSRTARAELPLHQLEIGHRGCGVTKSDRDLFDQLPCLPENTLASLSMAYYHGAHMVETDVVVTQDLEAVIFHDLEFGASDHPVPICNVPSKVLSNIPLPKLEISPTQAEEELLSTTQTVPSFVKDGVNLFPSLRHILQKLPAKLGIMLEVKSNLGEKGVAQVPYHNPNIYVDVILKELLQSAGDRQIILCSFCPTTCIMLRNKQSRWPVVLIVQGSTNTYPDYLDNRLRCLDLSAKLAISEGLHGISIFSGLLLESASETVCAMKEAGLTTFIWGYHCCDPQFRMQMRDSFIDGIIYDKIYEEKLEKRKPSKHL